MIEENIIYLLEEVDRACDLLTEDHTDSLFITDDELLEFLESTPLYKELPMCVINECLSRNNSHRLLKEDALEENAITSAIATVGKGLMKTRGIFTSLLTGPYAYLVTSLGLSAAMTLFRKMKSAAARRDQDAMNKEIQKAQAEIAAANANKSQTQQPIEQQPQQVVQQQKA